MISSTLPIPPLEMRALVGQTEASGFDNASGGPIFDFVDPSVFCSVFDFGCGCGRLARQLIQQQPRPERYIGIDLHAGMIAWCQRNLAAAARGFQWHLLMAEADERARVALAGGRSRVGLEPAAQHARRAGAYRAHPRVACP